MEYGRFIDKILYINIILLSLLCSNETNVMITLKKIPGMALESETIRGSFCVSTVEQPNPGLNIMEIWKDIPGYKGLYQASNLGRIKSLERYVNHPLGGKKYIRERILKYQLGLCRPGYYTVNLCKYNKCISFRIHRLVGFAFIPNPEDKPEINHKNGIKTDNRVENLEWVTYKENQIHASDVLGLNLYNRKPVAQYNRNGVLLNSFKSATDAARSINGDARNVSGICLGIGKTHRGYIFKYI